VAYEDLLKSVEESALEKERELKSRTAAAVEEIRNRARVQAEAARQGHLCEAEKSAFAERNRQIYLTNVENKEFLIRVREEAYARAFAGAAEQLVRLREDPKYPAIFARLVREAAATMGDGSYIVHTDRRDEALCKNTLAALRVTAEVRADIETAGGIVLGLPDRSVVLDNTVEARLERARERKRTEIHAILSGE
jgi:vacuolar-type H+-ATPase subunit E/Vma4